MRTSKDDFRQEFSDEYRSALQKKVARNDLDISKVMWMVWVRARQAREQANDEPS